MTRATITPILRFPSLAPFHAEMWNAAFSCVGAVWERRGRPCCGQQKSQGCARPFVTTIFQRRQGVEDDKMNILCFCGRTTGLPVAWDKRQEFPRGELLRCRPPSPQIS